MLITLAAAAAAKREGEKHSSLKREAEKIFTVQLGRNVRSRGVAPGQSEQLRKGNMGRGEKEDLRDLKGNADEKKRIHSLAEARP